MLQGHIKHKRLHSATLDRYCVAMTEKEDWAEAQAKVVAAEVARLRKAKRPKWSIKRLADETERLGYPIGQSVLSNFEYGRRGARLEVVELLVLAAALDVPPAQLLWPNYPDGIVEYLPNWPATAELAALIFTGQVRADFSTGADLPIGGQLREADALIEERRRLNETIRTFSHGVNTESLIQEVKRISERRAEINRRLAELGYEVTGDSNGEG